MNGRSGNLVLYFLLAVGAQSNAVVAEPDSARSSPQAVAFFENKIRPVLVDHCYTCHSAEADEVEGGLLLDSRAAIARGGDSGKVLIKRDPNASRLIKALRYADEDLQMPPDGRLSDEVIGDFEQWVRMGAPDPRDSKVLEPNEIMFERAKRHWSFQPPQPAERPSVSNAAWPRTDIDYLVLARLEQQDIAHSADADARTLVRRLSYDLTGLPPTYARVEAFAADPSDEAYTQLVDELLASKHFGERWARHWLDLARYGDTKGYVFREDRNYPHAYKYRDWVIRALNEDLPFDRFLTYQIAADRIADSSDRSRLAALGYLTLGRRFINNVHDIIDDRIDVVFRGMMGLTVSCARCHDHKYDPVTTEDYYALYGVFSSSREQQDGDLPLRLVDKDRAADVAVFLRGNPGNRGEQVPRRFLRFFAGDDASPFTQGSGRLELARRIADRNNPLTARVFANRVWSHLFGQGLVRTPSDFGLRSEPPLHRDVLDHLAVSFMDDSWSVKRLIRRIVLSSVYRQRSQMRDDASKADPENLLLWRARRRRLDFEAVRDSLLAVSGQLDPTIGGASVRVETMPPSRRRTLYAFIDRQNLPGLFRTFDFASPDTHSPQRPETTVPQQALYLMNSPFVQAMADKVVERIDDEHQTAARIRGLYRLVYARDPSAAELELGSRFVEQANDRSGALAERWQFGYGYFDQGKDGGVHFEPLPHYTGDAWQGGPERPDPQLGWVILTAAGGHAGNDQKHAAIRRWIAPRDGQLTITGRLEHPSDQGDGVQARIVSSRSGLLDEWTVKTGALDPKVSGVEIRKGDTIDFLVDCRSNPSFDSFLWRTTLRLAEASRKDSADMWKSEAGFRGPATRSMGVWQRYAQTLLLTNEFMFLD